MDCRSRSAWVRSPASWLLAVALVCAAVSPVRAGGGPENVLLVVNVNSWASTTIANHYADWRQIPSGNVLFVNWRFADEPLSVDDFRRLLLGPIMEEMRRRQIDEQIDYIIYSSDFPTEIDITTDMTVAKAPEEVARLGSLTGLTYLWTQTLFNDPRYVVPMANAYARERPNTKAVARTSGFRHWYGWSPEGELQEAGGSHYLLSMMLAVTHGRGTSPREALRALNAAARSDGTRPAGMIYFVQNSDPRSRARDDRYTAAVRALQPLGVRSSVLRGALPREKDDVQGVMMGIRQFDWAGSKSTIRPGAICDNLTDLGAVFRLGTGQTPLTEFIRFGAAGSSGAVATPYDAATQFPSPLLQVHYARGCTLAEAYYQSLPSPFQTLIVGDPLCRPWARIPKVTLDGVTTGQVVTGPMEVTPRVTGGAGAPDRFQFFVDGRRLGYARAGDNFALDSAALPDGYHELRVVAIENSTIETQGRAIVPITTKNHDRAIEFTATPADRVKWGEKLTLTARCPGASSIRIQRYGALVREISGEEGTVEIDPQHLGYGPVLLNAVVFGDTVADQAVSAPIKLQVLPSSPLPAQEIDMAALTDGLKLTFGDNRVTEVADTTIADWLGRNGVGPQETFSLSGVYQAPLADVYQFHIRFVGTLSVKIDGQVIDKFTSENQSTRIIPVVLAAGAHRIELSGTTGPQPKLEAQFGNQGVSPLGAPLFRHE